MAKTLMLSSNSFNIYVHVSFYKITNIIYSKVMCVSLYIEYICILACKEINVIFYIFIDICRQCYLILLI